MRHFSTEKFKSFLLAGTFTAFIGYVNRLSDSVIIGHVIGEVTLDLNDGILMTLRDDGVIFDITDADAKVSSLRTYLVASMMERHRDRINLVTVGWPAALRNYNGRTVKTESGKKYNAEYADRIVNRAINGDRHVALEIKVKK